MNVVAKPRRAVVLAFGEFIGVFDSAETHLLAYLDPAHRPHKSTEYVFLFPFDWQVGVEGSATADGGDIRGGVVLVVWSPSGNDRADGVDWRAFAKIVVDDDEASAETIFEGVEFLEGWVCLWLAFALPVVSLPDVERVIVAETAREFVGHVISRLSYLGLMMFVGISDHAFTM